MPVSIVFVESVNGEATAEEVMEGTSNQIRVMLEEALLELSEIVIAENFGETLRRMSAYIRLLG